jgi:hypothetical protein
MNELLTWGLPFAVALGLIALSYNQLQVASRSGDYLIAKIWFTNGALTLFLRFIYWGITTNRILALRIVVCVLVCGSLVWVTVEAFRSINHKRQRWIESNAGAAEEKSWHQTPEYDLTPPEKPRAAETRTIEEEKAPAPKEWPNLVYKDRSGVRAHVEGGIIVEGERNTRYPWYDENVTALVIEICNEFNETQKVMPAYGVTAQIFYKIGSVTLEVNRGAWLSDENRMDFGVNETKRLIIAYLPDGHDPKLLILRREYQRGGNLEAISAPLKEADYCIEVRLISEERGEVYLKQAFTLSITFEPFDFFFEPIQQLSRQELAAKLEGFLMTGGEILRNFPRDREKTEKDVEKVEGWEKYAARFLGQYHEYVSTNLFLSDYPEETVTGAAHSSNWPYLKRMATRLTRLKEIIDDLRRS